MAQQKTPGVTVKERSLLAPSVAEVPTAIPAFIGYTQLTTDEVDESLKAKPQRITNMMEFMNIFGGAYNEAISVEYKEASQAFVIPKEANATLADFFLYQAVEHFFANGGGACYVVSIGGFDTVNKDKADFVEAIDALKRIPEITLISCPESICMDEQSHYDVHNAALQHCEGMQERFALIDVQQGGHIRNDASLMRDKVTQGLKYGAAYYPYLKTSMPRSYDDSSVTVKMAHNYYKLHADLTSFVAYDDSIAVDAAEAAVKNASASTSEEDLKALYDKTYEETETKVIVDQFGVDAEGVFYSPHFIELTVDVSGNGETKVVNFAGKEVETANGAKQGQEITDSPVFGIYRDKMSATNYLNASGQVIVNTLTNGELAASESTGERIAAKETLEVPLSVLNDAGHALGSTAAYNQVKAKLSKHYLQLPPSAAIAGVMAKTDKDHGVWKAPANVALTNVLEPALDIDDSEQEDLNVDVIAGKSINAIRSFRGKGNLVWGARTLDGNSNEWRYVPVRRLFNMVEESIKNASGFAVFEANNSFTWLKIKTTIEGYLEKLYSQGALFGSSPEEAFFVNVGLGQTMTEDDINNGIMNIEIGIAAVRPAEFIVLTFSHKSIAA